ncbi:hypothetical protein BpHYR1_010566 [Brachionus plicatilis]|uniref:Uncharacterized protein n=1 Tax=Brachionus plicatilis TaxID=10195 RepID=A0A3M7PNY4_BRAPC|nr:hypothetical protein BpHYR1_010566 [Brachionus plicatilis]
MAGIINVFHKQLTNFFYYHEFFNDVEDHIVQDELKLYDTDLAVVYESDEDSEIKMKDDFFFRLWDIKYLDY